MALVNLTINQLSLNGVYARSPIIATNARLDFDRLKICHSLSSFLLTPNSIKGSNSHFKSFQSQLILQSQTKLNSNSINSSFSNILFEKIISVTFGGIFNFIGIDFFMNECTFKNLVSPERCPAFYLQNGTLIMKRCYISSCGCTTQMDDNFCNSFLVEKSINVNIEQFGVYNTSFRHETSDSTCMLSGCSSKIRMFNSSESKGYRGSGSITIGRPISSNFRYLYIVNSSEFSAFVTYEIANTLSNVIIINGYTNQHCIFWCNCELTVNESYLIGCQNKNIKNTEYIAGSLIINNCFIDGQSRRYVTVKNEVQSADTQPVIAMLAKDLYKLHNIPFNGFHNMAMINVNNECNSEYYYGIPYTYFLLDDVMLLPAYQ